jgi:hypothetical protein
MPSLGHVHALAGASGPSLIFSSLVSIRIGGWPEQFGRTDYPTRKLRPFAHHLHPMRRLCSVVRFGSRLGRSARRGIARSRAQKFGNPERLRLAAIRSSSVARLEGSSGVAAVITSPSPPGPT